MSDVLDALSFDGLSVEPDAELTVPGSLYEYACEVCGVELHYAGKGRHPRHCDDHKPGRARAKTPAKGTRARRAKQPKRGHPAAEVAVAIGWQLAGVKVAMDSDLPGPMAAGRVMQLQAPDAGVRVARLIDPFVSKLTILNKVSTGGPMADLAAVIAPPLIVGLIAQNPKLLTYLEPMLGMLLTPLAEGILAAQAEQHAVMEKLTEPSAETSAAVQELITQVFQGLIPEGNTSETPAA